MKKTIGNLSIFGTLLMTGFLYAQEEVELWKEGEKPFYKENSLKEYETEVWGTTVVRDITEPTITIYGAKGENTGTGVLIIPGGGYELVAMYHEGYDVAKLLTQQGITAAVLKYRIPDPRSSNDPGEVPLADGRRALQLLHVKATEYGIDTEKIGVLGFSAGGHLAAVLSVWKSEEQNENPDFTALIYGVTNLSTGNREWLEKNLYHRKMTEDEIAKNTLWNLVDQNTPQTFLVHAADDDLCHLIETTGYAQKLFENGVPAETHIFPKGGHGFGVGHAAYGTNQWVSLFVNWLKYGPF